MCYQNPALEYKIILEPDALVGYRNWRVPINKTNNLKSLVQDYLWPTVVVSHELTECNSGIYSYNNYDNNYSYNYNCSSYNNNNYYYNNNYNYHYCNYHYNNNYYSYYDITGTILLYGKVAIHTEGYRSQYAKVKTLFTIRKSDAKGSNNFLNWINEFNTIVEHLAKKYKSNTMHWQDFIDSQTQLLTIKE